LLCLFRTKPIIGTIILKCRRFKIIEKKLLNRNFIRDILWIYPGPLREDKGHCQKHQHDIWKGHTTWNFQIIFLSLLSCVFLSS
jgi:hypothetical protein